MYLWPISLLKKFELIVYKKKLYSFRNDTNLNINI